jgi:hypothetical protein
VHDAALKKGFVRTIRKVCLDGKMSTIVSESREFEKTNSGIDDFFVSYSIFLRFAGGAGGSLLRLRQPIL